MPANPAHYNTADHLRWEQYANALHSAGTGHGPFPGPTPTRYWECFRTTQKYAPLPEDYLALINSGDHNTGASAMASAEVSMSAAALGTMLDSQLWTRRIVPLPSESSTQVIARLFAALAVEVAEVGVEPELVRDATRISTTATARTKCDKDKDIASNVAEAGTDVKMENADTIAADNIPEEGEAVEEPEDIAT
ncbi:hypothetical protein B0H17DRAFT_1133507 [Mycena rosella]|uniref:Uncharacterized protein n=1 Tax=Mycena rosella TaxID=1033263 RepID=A0AAD7GF34_MYCRO|nr:hypothetical protein B0H17DRAFT_1133507 [Mycena rosella]